MESRNQRFKLYTSVLAVLFAVVSTAHLSSIVLSNGTVVYAYSNSQAQSFVNECTIDGLTNLNCANNGPLMQGDGLASSPVVTQSGGGGQQEPSSPPSPPSTTGFTVEGEGEGTPGNLIVCEDGMTLDSTFTFPIEFSAQSDGTVTGTYTISIDSPLPDPVTPIEEGVITDGSTDGLTFTLSGVGESLCSDSSGDDVTGEITISGDCGDSEPIAYRDPVTEGTFIHVDVECTLT